MFSRKYYDQVYAGILGKIIGVYIGRPFEGWSHDKIVKTFGEIDRYVHEYLNHPLIVSDDDITGTFLFAHSIEDHNFRLDFNAKHIGQSWLDYLIEGKTILWWGGYGMSTEHTAYLNLKNGIDAPMSGSIEVNGKAVAEQIGAQIFIDAWALINPNKPEKAVQLAREASLVSHDGEAVYAACLLVAMESAAFSEKDLNKLIDIGLSFIPNNCKISNMISNIRLWYNEDPHDWKWAFSKLEKNYGYDKFPGNCHIIPNHGLVILSLLYGGNSFHKSMKIVNTLGWDTDCNAANVGCLNGIRLGLDAIQDGYDWRTPVADRILLPTASSQSHIFDAVQETDKLVSIANKIHFEKITKRKKKFHFTPKGSVQGFQIQKELNTCPTSWLENNNSALEVHFKYISGNVPTRVETATFTPKEYNVNSTSYHILGSPTLYSGQIVSGKISSKVINNQLVSVIPYIKTYSTKGDEFIIYGKKLTLSIGEISQFKWKIPDTKNNLISSLGFEIQTSSIDSPSISGSVHIHYLDWYGNPNLSLIPASNNNAITDTWMSCFINTMDQQMHFSGQNNLRLMNNKQNEAGLFVFGSNDWENYTVSIDMIPHTKKSFGAVFSYQGKTRYFVAELTADNKLKIIKNEFNKRKVLAEKDYSWSIFDKKKITIQLTNKKITCIINDEKLIIIDNYDEHRGLVGVYNEYGQIQLNKIDVY